MKLYLTSVFWDGLVDLIDSKPSQTNAVYIPTAADPYDDKWFIDEDRKNLKALDFSIQEINLSQETPKKITDSINQAGLVILSGGNSFYLLDSINRSGIRDLLVDRVNQDMIFAGASAGAVVTCPDIGFAASLDDPGAAKDLKSTKGLGLTELTTLPHFGKAKYQAKYDQALKIVEKENLKAITLTDNQALLIDNNLHTVIEFDKPPKE